MARSSRSSSSSRRGLSGVEAWEVAGVARHVIALGIRKATRRAEQGRKARQWEEWMGLVIPQMAEVDVFSEVYIVFFCFPAC